MWCQLRCAQPPAWISEYVPNVKSTAAIIAKQTAMSQRASSRVRRGFKLKAMNPKPCNSSVQEMATSDIAAPPRPAAMARTSRTPAVSAAKI